MMLGLYFSGTGNTKYCTERFVHRLDSAGTCLAMESIGTAAAILSHEDIVLAYPVYFSNLPKLVQAPPGRPGCGVPYGGPAGSAPLVLPEDAGLLQPAEN